MSNQAPGSVQKPTARQVRRRDGQLVNFERAKLEADVKRLLEDAGVNQPGLAKRVVAQVMGRLERHFEGAAVPTTDDVVHVVAMTLIDHNVGFAVKRYFEALMPAVKTQAEANGHGLRFKRFFTKEGTHPYQDIEWEQRDAVIRDSKGKAVFEQLGVEVPKTWSQTATNISVSKYFRGEIGKPERETSVKQMIDRVAQNITDWGASRGYFASDEDARTFEAELTYLLVTQRAAFNSPVWFNVGVSKRPQCSACFINSVTDDMRSILNLAVTEGMLFKYGSGTGSNLSSLRSSKEKLSRSSGKSSGPVSFMKGFDAFAGIIKSGGKTRRAAKMVMLNVEHPDIVEFIECKVKEERKAKALMAAGYDGSIDGEAYSSIFFQNANNSVRVTDDFMRAVERGTEWQTKAVMNGEVMETMPARDVMRKMAAAAWECGDPGIQYDTTINQWNPASNSGRINGSNPCVTGDTLIATADGWQRIDALLEKPFRVIGGDGQLHEVSAAFPTGTKPVYRLTTNSGYELKLTADHRVFTLNRGDVPAAELTIDDRISLGQPAFGGISIDERLAEFLGLMLGDGCLAGEQETAIVTLAPEEREVAERVHANLTAYRNEHGADGRAMRETEITQPQETLRFGTSARCVVDELKKFAVLAESSENKALTTVGLGLDRVSAAAVLRGLYTADGTVANYGDKSHYISLDSTSMVMLQQVQLLLLSFGIKAKLYRDRRVMNQKTVWMPDGQGGRKEYPVQQIHSLRISREARVIFEKEIGFLAGSAKAEALKKLNEEVGTYSEPLTDGIFVSPKYLGEEPVYDLTEPVTSHFVANGLVVHNCSEYMFLDDSACNLASLNLMKFRGQDGEFDIPAFQHAVDVMLTAQEFCVGGSSYPTPSIEQNSHDFRPLGLGYANLGALLMSRGLAYDSDEGRDFAGAVTALMTGRAYRQSAVLARAVGPFAFYRDNETPFSKVINQHRDLAYNIQPAGVPQGLFLAARQAWDDARDLGQKHGYRNAQVTVLAPTGTIGFLMDCDTTGVEPDIALVKYKWLVGGGMMKIVNQTVPEALHRLGYSPDERAAILEWIDKNDTIEGAPGLKPAHLAVFDCAFKPAKGDRSIHYMGHLKMMAAVQPFLSGAISKTVNLPHEASVEDIEDVYMEGWRLGLKAVAIYRDGSKGQQVLTLSKDEKKEEKATEESAEKNEVIREVVKEVERVVYKPMRRRLPDERKSLTHKFSIAGHEGYITVGLYDDGTPGEFFIRMAKGGTVVAGLIDSFATVASIAIQYGVPLKVLCAKFVHLRFEPSGFTSNPNIRIAKSIMDYLFRWMALKFLPIEDQRALGVNLDVQTLGEKGQADVMPNLPPTPEATPILKHTTCECPAPAAALDAPEQMNLEATAVEPSGNAALTSTFAASSDAPVCDTCGSLMVRNGACYKCLNCGSTSGCS